MKNRPLFFRYIVALLAFTAPIISVGQPASRDRPSVPDGVIYGSFIQRLGLSSGGFAQEMRVYNIGTKMTYPFPVKPTFRSARENWFIHHLPAGTYVVLNYTWTRSTWYGGKMFKESIFKNGTAAEVDAKLQSGELARADVQWYWFTVKPNTLTYVGTWHFDTERVFFSNDKATLDRKLAREIRRIKADSVSVSIPE